MRKKRKKKVHPLNFIFSILISLLLFYLTAEQTTKVEFPTENSEIHFYSNHTNDDLTNTYLQAFKKAKDSILVMVYGISDPSILYELNKKASEGVNVHVISDGNASPSLKRELQSNVLFHPIYDKGLMHLKIVVIDNHLVLIGSSNLTKQSLKIHGNLVFGVHSENLANFVKNRANDIVQGNLKPSLAYQKILNKDRTLEFYFLPQAKIAVNKIISLIDSAKKTIQVSMFTFTRDDFAEALIRAKKRGVSVKVVLDKDSSNNASKKIAGLFKAKKIPVYVNNCLGLNHHKFLYIDEEILVNGSANWTKAAFTQNYDCFMILSLDSVQKEKMNSLCKNMLLDSKKFGDLKMKN